MLSPGNDSWCVQTFIMLVLVIALKCPKYYNETRLDLQFSVIRNSFFF